MLSIDTLTSSTIKIDVIWSSLEKDVLNKIFSGVKIEPSVFHDSLRYFFIKSKASNVKYLNFSTHLVLNIKIY